MLGSSVGSDAALVGVSTRVEGFGLGSTIPVALRRLPRLSSRACESEPTGRESEPSGPTAAGNASDLR
eukprot:15449265-Alexandrium_andersonii.AAC.1